MHFLVEICERDHPDLLSFADELIHLDDASGIDAGEIKKSLNQMDSNIKNLERDLENAGRVQNKDPDDRLDQFFYTVFCGLWFNHFFGFLQCSRLMALSFQVH